MGGFGELGKGSQSLPFIKEKGFGLVNQLHARTSCQTSTQNIFLVTQHPDPKPHPNLRQPCRPLILCCSTQVHGGQEIRHSQA